MPRIEVDALVFDFPNTWEVSEFDTWSFYRNQFLNLGNNVRMACSNCQAELKCRNCNTTKNAGMKASDILAVTGAVAWLIEVKDYRNQQRTKAIGLGDEIALKVRDSLAVLVAAAANANDDSEKSLARKALRCGRLRIVLHLEQRTTPSRAFPRAISPAAVLQRLKQLVKCIDPQPKVVETANMQDLPWSVS